MWISNAELQEAAEVLHRTFVKEAVSVSASREKCAGISQKKVIQDNQIEYTKPLI